MSGNREVLALLIDGDNVQASLVPPILDKISEYGKLIIKQVYLNKPSLTHWETIINEYSLKPELVPNNTSGKNAGDIALVIDAMELLYERSDITGFCIVSSDSDFRRLAEHIVAKNKLMLGIGEDKTPKSFVNACSEFIYITDLLQPQLPLEQPIYTSDQPNDDINDISTSQTFEKLFIQAYENIAKDTDGWVQLVEVKEQMKAVDAEFQLRNYQNMRRLAEKVKAMAEAFPIGVIEINEKLESKPVIHHLRVDCDTFRFIEAYDRAPARDRDGWVLLSAIGVELRKQPAYENGFSYHGSRNKRLLKIVTEMIKDYPTIELIEENDGNSPIHFVRVK